MNTALEESFFELHPEAGVNLSWCQSKLASIEAGVNRSWSQSKLVSIEAVLNRSWCQCREHQTLPTIPFERATGSHTVGAIINCMSASQLK